MAAYYHHTHNTTEIPTTAAPDHHGLHTLILMNNPSFHPPPPSHNILLNNNNITLYGYPQLPVPLEVARDPISSGAHPQGSLSLTLYGPRSNDGIPPSSEADVDADVAGGGGGGPVLLGSKYLKPAQELLEEVVQVGDHGVVVISKTSNGTNDDHSPTKTTSSSEEREKRGGGGQHPLTTADRQEIQMKKAKLLTMLDEAEQRYRQYHHQMQIIISAFEQAAGMGSAKAYTALALKTISKQFKCLKDAIQGQIRAANKALGEEEAGGSGGGGGSGGKMEGSTTRLKLIDHQIRQQRALQQLGMIPNGHSNAWRPQRGLPERSVSVLRAWLFEHFLHPYPKDSDKIMLAKQTGLTRSQVSNWFINARVRLWKPMIEEMYMEEAKEQEENKNGTSEEKTSTKENSSTNTTTTTSNNNHEDHHQAASNSTTDQDKKTNIIIPTQNNAAASHSPPSLIPIPEHSGQSPFKGNNNNNNNQLQGFSLSGLLGMEEISQGSPKRQRNDEFLHCNGNGNNNREMLIKFGNEKHHEERDDHGYPMIPGGMNFIGGAYPTIGEIGRFGNNEEEFPPQARFLPGNGNGNGNGNGISLSLGLPPSENHHQEWDTQTIHFRRGNDFDSQSQAAGFECIDIQNRKAFVTQLLPDFVA